MKTLFTSLRKKMAYSLFLPFFLMPLAINAQWVFEVTSPAEIAGQYPMGTAEFGGSISDTLSGTITLGEDGSADPTLGCEELTTDLSGAIGLLDRGDCPFSQKAENAEIAGADALIIANSTNEIINMPGSNQNVTIPSVLIEESLGDAIKAALENGDVEVSIFRIQQEVVWGGTDDPNSTFDGSLNDWTTQIREGWRSQAEPDSFIWLEEGDVTDGLVSNEDNIINSPTQANGAAGMNLDLLTTGGVTNPGSPPYPFYVAELVSPVIDLSDNTSALSLSFYQLIRILNDVGEDFYTAVQFSTDGGDSWGLPVVINDELASQERAQNQIVLPMPENTWSAEEFRMKFVISMDFYYWVIDDVVITELPQTNISITDAFKPISSWATPAAHMPSDTFGFQVSMRNQGFELDSVSVEAQVTNAETNEVMHSQTEVVTNFGSGFDTVTFENSFVPDLEVGDYILRYRIDPINQIDLGYENNFESYPFRVTDVMYSKDDPDNEEAGNSSSPDLPQNADTWMWGNAYFISEVSAPGSQPVMLGTEHSFVAGQDSFTDETVAIWLLEFAGDGPVFDFNLVDEELNTLPTNNHPAFSPVAVGIVTSDMLKDAGSGNVLSLDAQDFIDPNTGASFEGPIELNENKLYFVMAEISDTNVGRVRIGNTDDTYDVANGLLYWPNANGEMRNWTGFTNVTPIARMRTDIINSASQSVTKDDDITVYPQPAKDEMYINFDYQESKDVDLEMIDMSGQVVKTSQHKNVSSQIVRENVQTIQSGNYIIRIITKDGVRTTKVLVVK